MGYHKALEAAGATVYVYAKFGSWQGDWWAKTSLGWIHGYYGSCSGCDAFAAEMGLWDDHCKEHYYDGPLDDCSLCQMAKKEYEARLRLFGQRYLEDAITFDEALAIAKKDEEWDAEAQDVINWLEENK